LTLSVYDGNAGELKRRRDFVAGRNDVMMTSQQVLPGDMGSMTSLCADDDDVSVCLLLVGSTRSARISSHLHAGVADVQDTVISGICDFVCSVCV